MKRSKYIKPIIFMKKCRVVDAIKKEFGTILLWKEDGYKVGIILVVPYIGIILKEVYLLSTDDNEIYSDLLSKSNLTDKIIECH
jgi:hypothetical protein